MDNIAFIDEEDIPLVHQDDEDYDDYNTPNTSRAETSFIEPTDATEPTSTLRLRQKLKRDKIISVYRYLSVTGGIGLIDLDRFWLTKDPKKGVTIVEFYNSNDIWVPLTKQTGEFLAAKTLRDRFGGVNTMKNFLGLDETPPVLERSIKAATKLRRDLPTDLKMESIPLGELSSLTEEIHVKTREASQQTTLDMREFLAIDKALQNIQGELVNNTSKLTDQQAVNKRSSTKR